MKALITTLLLLGSSTAALAQPIQAAPYRYEPDSRYDHRFDDRRDDRFERRGWSRRPVVLAQNVSLFRQWNRDQRPTLIDIDQRAGRFERLRIDHEDGRMFVNSVTVMFANGGSRTYTVNQMLSQRSPSITLDLDGRIVTSMYINGNATRGRATFDVIGLRR